ncbi:MAG: ABC transporter permease [Bacteroidales bacterium]|nr:MAG: ABC transporter permease [Bacteroidales bacterium]
MYKKYLLPSVRFLSRKIGYSIINITGLSVGIAIGVLLFIYVYDELTFNQFNEKLDRIHLVCIDSKFEGAHEKSSQTSPPMAEALIKEYPEIEKVARVFPFWENENVFLRFKDNIVPNLKVLAADSSFFDIFTFHFIKGYSSLALNRPNTVVITESTAKKFFGDKNPIGEVISFLYNRDYEVTGVVEDCPKNSDIYFDVVLSATSFYAGRDRTSWLSTYITTYALLKPNADRNTLNDKMPAFVRNHCEPVVKEYFKVSFDEYFKNGDYYNFFFEPYNNVHLSKDGLSDNSDKKRMLVLVLGVVGLLVLALASINYINLATAMSSTRFKEIGVKKTFGASKSFLTKQFVGEAIIICLLSMALGMLLVEILLPTFNNLMEKSYEINYLTNPLILPGLFMFAIILGILSGLYPGLVMSSQKTISILKDKQSISSNNRSNWFRNALVIFQFTVCIVIMIVTITINRQIRYMQDKNMGLDKEQVLVLDMIEGLKDKKDLFKETILRNPSIKSLSYVNTTPTRDFAFNGHHVIGSPLTENLMVASFVADYDIVKSLGLKVVKGRELSVANADDQYGVLINETLANKISKEDPLSIKFDDNSGAGLKAIYSVRGIVKDFNFSSLNEKIKDLIIYPSKGLEDRCNYAIIKLSTQNIAETVNSIENLYKKNTVNYPFKYTFLDDDYNKLFKQEIRARKLLSICIAIAIFIATLGLLGLASFIIKKKTKEIGIRKALGATIMSIEVKLIMQFSKWIIISNLIAWPIAYYFSNKWLDGFAYRTNFNWLTLFIVAICSLGIAMLTVAYHTYMAASKKPIETLRYE